MALPYKPSKGASALVFRTLPKGEKCTNYTAERIENISRLRLLRAELSKYIGILV